MGRGAVVCWLVAIWAGAAGAEVPDTSPVPRPNPVYAQAVAAADGSIVPLGGPEQSLLTVSLRPLARPKGLGQGAAKSKSQTPEIASAKGAVCGVGAIKGEKIAPIKGKVKGCGLQEGVRVTSVSGVRLSQAITVDCATALALNTWVRDVLQPTYDGKVSELRIAAHYMCRTRNNKKGAKISEHGRGKAVDVAGFVLSSGKTVTVAANYDKTLRRAHKAACGIFSTTLGPGSDGYHEDHLHLDTASGRSSAYCR